MITIETPNSKRFKILISPKVLKITEIKKNKVVLMTYLKMIKLEYSKLGGK